MSDLPNPLTPPGCDLSDFQYMELDVRRLRDSKFSASTSGEGFRAGILLWCAAWHQIPSASLPDDDVELANLAGYGRVIREWKKVREEALHGFIKCSDGRLYHPVIAEKAIISAAHKERHAYARFTDRLRKENSRRVREKKPELGIPTHEQWKSGAYPHGIPPDDTTISVGIPPEITLNRTERERSGNGAGAGAGTITHSVPDGTGGGAAGTVEEMTKDELWTAGKSLLHADGRGLPLRQCGSFVGKLVKDYGDEVVIDAVRSAVVTRPVDPVEYLKACCMSMAARRGGKAKPIDRDARDAEAMRLLGINPQTQGAADAS